MNTIIKYRKTIVIAVTAILGVLTALNVDTSAVTGLVQDIVCPAAIETPVPSATPTESPNAG